MASSWRITAPPGIFLAHPIPAGTMTTCISSSSCTVTHSRQSTRRSCRSIQTLARQASLKKDGEKGKQAMTDFTIRPLNAADCDWVKAFSIQHCGSDTMVAHGEIFLISQMPGFAAEAGAEVVGLITYHIAGNACEVTSLDSLREAAG